MGRDEGREAGEPSLTEMSQQKITHTGSSGLIAGEMFVKGWCNGREKSLDFFFFFNMRLLLWLCSPGMPFSVYLQPVCFKRLISNILFSMKPFLTAPVRYIIASPSAS